jgi:hypothetical protein
MIVMAYLRFPIWTMGFLCDSRAGLHNLKLILHGLIPADLANPNGFRIQPREQTADREAAVHWVRELAVYLLNL